MGASKKIASSTLPIIAEIILPETPSADLGASTALAIIPYEGTEQGASQAAPAPSTPTEAERATLSILTLFGARETKQTIIHPSLWGLERWFAKSRLHSYSKGADGVISLILPTAELTYRDSVLTEPLAIIAEYTGDYSLANKGGSYSRLHFNAEPLAE